MPARTLLFEWDDSKARSNLEKHGLSFESATAVFLDPDRLELDTERAGDGERRVKAIGLIENRLFTVVFTVRGGVTRIISARRSNAREERAHGALRSESR